LTNLLQKDIWLSMPPLATLDYMTKMAQFVFDNLNFQSIIYVEMSSNIGFNGHNRTANMLMIRAWKSVFNDLNSRQRLKFILSTTRYGYFENVMSKYSANDLNEFDAYSIRGEIAYYSPFNFNGYNITLSANFTTDKINDIIRQQIYNDDKDNIYQIQKVAYTFNFGSIMSNPVIKKPLIAYGSDFLVNAPSFAYRAKMATPTSPELVKMEQDLENSKSNNLKPIDAHHLLDILQEFYRINNPERINTIKILKSQETFNYEQSQNQTYTKSQFKIQQLQEKECQLQSEMERFITEEHKCMEVINNDKDLRC
jgi:hypothetical protein